MTSNADGGEGDPCFRVHIGPAVLRRPNPPFVAIGFALREFVGLVIA